MRSRETCLLHVKTCTQTGNPTATWTRVESTQPGSGKHGSLRHEWNQPSLHQANTALYDTSGITQHAESLRAYEWLSYDLNMPLMNWGKTCLPIIRGLVYVCECLFRQGKLVGGKILTGGLDKHHRTYIDVGTNDMLAIC